MDVGLWQFHSSIDHPNFLLLYFKHRIEFFLSVCGQLQGLVTRLNILMLKSIKISRLLRGEEEFIGSFNQQIVEKTASEKLTIIVPATIQGPIFILEELEIRSAFL